MNPNLVPHKNNEQNNNLSSAMNLSQVDLKLTKGIIGKSCRDSVDSFLTIFSIYSINHIYLQWMSLYLLASGNDNA